jgi:hypothetical protein
MKTIQSCRFGGLSAYRLHLASASERLRVLFSGRMEREGARPAEHVAPKKSWGEFIVSI